MLSFLITHLHAADYTLLEKLPLGKGGDIVGSIDVSTYIPAMIKLIIAIAGGLAVIRIIIGGIQYMSTDAFSGKSSAKETIQNALIGLLLAISAYTILNTVNPGLVNIQFALQPVKQGQAIKGSLATKTAAELGCTNNCVPIAAIIPIDSNACTNNPCYVQKTLNDRLLAFWSKVSVVRDAIDDAKGEYVAVPWEISAAFPFATSTTPLTVCNTKDLSQAGSCIDISLTPDTTETQVARFLRDLQVTGNVDFQYHLICNSSRYNSFMTSAKLASYKSKFTCFGNIPEGIRVRI
ncbi:pilin [Candidatus Parcubacteria bacterium]|nr:pilin [Candidatus Parcubacteria bacterium]